MTDAITAFEDRIFSILKRFKTKQYIIALTDGANFRKEILETYKGNRDDRNKPHSLSALREHIQAHHKTYQRPGLEADDVLGILATSTRIFPEGTRRIIVSVDKDMKCIPGEFYHSKKDKHYQITPESAAYHHCFQTLTGDITDGYPGCPGIGQRKATKLLDGLNDAPKPGESMRVFPLTRFVVRRDIAKTDAKTDGFDQTIVQLSMQQAYLVGGQGGGYNIASGAGLGGRWISV